MANKFLFMSNLSISLKGKASTYRRNPLKHDLRLHAPDQILAYINPEKTKDNILLFAERPLPRSRDELKDWEKSLKEENNELFKHLKEKGEVSKNQGYKIANPHVHFALRNLVYKDPDSNALKELGWEDLSETLKKASGEAIFRIFHQRIGFGRGKPKKRRLQEEKPLWKVIRRSVI